MLDHGIATRRGVMCAHREPSYPRGTWSCGINDFECDCKEFSCARLENSEMVQDTGLVIPLYNNMSEEDQDLVVENLRNICISEK